jgi:S-DNA-T family DNA segregation ATPase FtsK/SpoIIIE
LYEPRDAGGRFPPGGAVSAHPFRVDALPVSVTADEVLARRAAAGPGSGIPPPSALLIGVGGDELLPQGIRLPAGSVLAVLGGPGSGKTTLLAALPAMNPAFAWLAAPAGTDPGRYWSGLHTAALAGTLERSAIALADDADLLSAEANSSLAGLNSLGWRVIVTSDFGPAFGHRVTLAAAARSQGRAVLIRPRGFLDAEAFGVRFEPEHNPPPGRAVVISDGRATPVQLAADRAVP